MEKTRGTNIKHKRNGRKKLSRISHKMQPVQVEDCNYNGPALKIV